MNERGTSYEGLVPAGQAPEGQAPSGKPPAGPGGQRRVALVIGNGAYAHASRLDNPVNDARAMAAILTRLGFDVVKGLDLDLRAMGDVQEKFEARLRGKPEVALLFYAGHGLQVKGRNYLVPIDAQIEAQAHLASRAILFNDILEPMADDAGASLIFLDACRDNPFTRNLARTFGDGARSAGVRGGLARIEKVAGTFISYATAPDTVAYDGKGDNSPFTGALLRHIETPGLSVSDMMIDVRNGVLAETNNRQEPWDQSSLRTRFYFVPEEIAHAPTVTQSVAKSPVMSAAADEWAAVKDTTSLATLALFKERYPDPPWGEYADIRENELQPTGKQRPEKEEVAKGQDQWWMIKKLFGTRNSSELIPRWSWFWLAAMLGWIFFCFVTFSVHSNVVLITSTISMISAIWLMWKYGGDVYRDEYAIYWLGGSISGIVWCKYLGMSFNIVFGDLFGSIIVIISAGRIFQHRLGRSSIAEKTIYYFGIAFAGIFLYMRICYAVGLDWLGLIGFYAAWSAVLLIAIRLAIWRMHSSFYELATYLYCGTFALIALLFSLTVSGWKIPYAGPELGAALGSFLAFITSGFLGLVKKSK